MWVRRRSFAGLALASCLIWIAICWTLASYDNPLLLLVRFVALRCTSIFRSSTDDERWLLSAPGAFPVTDDDVALIVKTGYGTQDRIPAVMEALGVKAVGADTQDGERNGLDNILVVGDFEKQLKIRGREVKIHDMVAVAFHHDAVVAKTAGEGERLQKYTNLTQAIREGRTKAAENLAKQFGWELDAVKFIPSLEMAYRTIPNKKWYVMQDDDTYLVKQSLYRVLAHLDSNSELYIGNAVGDFKGRFAHGGSGFAVSHKAMSRLFDDSPHVVYEAYKNALPETWGDKLVATTLLRVGVYLDERFNHFFNGAAPLDTRVSADRFCSPIVSFHHLINAAQMREAGRTFGKAAKPVSWRDLWKIYDQPSLEDMAKLPSRSPKDHVGEFSEVTFARTVETPEQCMSTCQDHSRNCLAWTWEKKTKKCYNSPWIVVGTQRKDCWSGVNVNKVRNLVEECGKWK